VAARDGVEDLHAAGAFTDQQAPSLNRRVRGRIYEALIATGRRDSRLPSDPFTAYVDNFADRYKGSHGTAAIKGAVAQAVDDFAAAEAIDSTIARQLREAAIKGAMEAYTIVRRLDMGRTQNEQDDQAAVSYWINRIPKYWEEPEVGPELQRLLDRAPRG
jgi:hypothetical protein